MSDGGAPDVVDTGKTFLSFLSTGQSLNMDISDAENFNTFHLTGQSPELVYSQSNVQTTVSIHRTLNYNNVQKQHTTTSLCTVMKIHVM